MKCREAALRYITLKSTCQNTATATQVPVTATSRGVAASHRPERSSVRVQEWKAPPPGAHWQHQGQLPAPPRGEALYHMQWPMLLQLHLVLMCHPLRQCRLKSSKAAGDIKAPLNQSDVDALMDGLCCRSASRTSRSW